MRTLREITDTDGGIYALEIHDGDLFVRYSITGSDHEPHAVIPMPPLVLEMFAAAVRPADEAVRMRECLDGIVGRAWDDARVVADNVVRMRRVGR